MSGELAARIAGCTHCARHLPHPPRPVVRFSPTARLLIIGQAPGARVHASGVPWDDASGERLCEWTGLEPATLRDPARVALVPMGFCYPGKGAGADLPPRPECAPLWHDAVLAVLPADRLTLLVGSHAQARYLPRSPGMSMTDRVREAHRWGPDVIALPHPSWRSAGWMARNPWFAERVLPRLQARVRQFV